MTARSSARSLPARLLATAAALVLVGGLAACGDDGDDVNAADEATDEAPAADGGGDPYGGGGATGGDGGTATDDAATSDGPTVVAAGFAFEGPGSVPAGSEVTFTNEDSAPHTMTADDGAFDSGTVEGGQSGTVTAPSEPGDYAYHCEIHPNMQATLTVE